MVTAERIEDLCVFATMNEDECWKLGVDEYDDDINISHS